MLRFTYFYCPMQYDRKPDHGGGILGGISFSIRGIFPGVHSEGFVAITDIEIKRAKPQQKSYRLSDSGGLHLVISPAGGKLWRWKYRFEGKEKLMGLGKYPQVPLAMARERHSEGRKLLATGVDPIVQRKAKKTAELVSCENSFERVADKWLEHWKDDKSLRHVDSTRRRLNSNILPSLAPLQIAAIEAPDIVAMVRAIEARGARDIAKRALETTGQIFRYAILTATQGATRPRRFDRVTSL